MRQSYQSKQPLTPLGLYGSLSVPIAIVVFFLSDWLIHHLFSNACTRDCTDAVRVWTVLVGIWMTIGSVWILCVIRARSLSGDFLSGEVVLVYAVSIIVTAVIVVTRLRSLTDVNDPHRVQYGVGLIILFTGMLCRYFGRR